MRLERGGRIVNGVGADTDIIIASAKAYIEALNLISRGGIRQHPRLRTCKCNLAATLGKPDDSNGN